MASRDAKIEDIIRKISNKMDALVKKIQKDKARSERLRIIMRHVGRQNLLRSEERNHQQLMMRITQDTNALKEHTEVLKSFFKNSKRYTEQEINGLHRGSLRNIVDYVKIFSP